jgi:hypothetical protein
MAYIGSTPTSQNFIAGTDYFNGTGSQTAFTLTRSVNSVNDIELVINNVIQQPNSYTVSGNTLTISAAPSSGTSNVYVRYLSTTLQSITVPNNSITYAKLDSNLQADIQGRNKIINGDMRIDQRNSGASVTAGTAAPYTVDRWFAYGSQASKYTVQQSAGSITPPNGHSTYLGCTSSSAYSIGSSDIFVIIQRIEGYNIADLGWGTTNAKTVTLSFWVRSSLTGTFGGTLNNNTQDRSYTFSYTINSANTWEQKSITIVGEQTGTWSVSNNTGIQVNFSLGTGSTYSSTAGSWTNSALFSATGATSVVGTSGATWYITGVQLEEGTTATSFEREIYSVTLQKCQRYYQKVTVANQYVPLVTLAGANDARATWFLPVVMRTTPTLSSTASTWVISTIVSGANSTGNSLDITGSATPTSLSLRASGGSGGGGTAGHPAYLYSSSNYFDASSEL